MHRSVALLVCLSEGTLPQILESHYVLRAILRYKESLGPGFRIHIYIYILIGLQVGNYSSSMAVDFCRCRLGCNKRFLLGIWLKGELGLEIFV